MSDRSIAQRLGHVRWLGGGSGGGKSTIAADLATRHGLLVYDSDAAIARHVQQSDLARHPLLRDFVAMAMDDRWLNRTPDAMFDSFWAFHGEAFESIVEDLVALPDDSMILAEGFRLLPKLVSPLMSRADQAVWLLPSPVFRRSVFEVRPSTRAIVSRTSDPRRALENLLARDALFTDAMSREVAELGLQAIRVDVGDPLDVTRRRVEVALGLESA
jgi:2-phosphoglycerate kinase